MKKGDKVLYKKIEYIDRTCECCGHEDYDVVEKEVWGIIEDIKKESVYNLNNGFITTEKVEIKDGKKVITPYISKEIKPIEKETVYKIDGCWLTGNVIIKR